MTHKSVISILAFCTSFASSTISFHPPPLSLLLAHTIWAVQSKTRIVLHHVTIFATCSCGVCSHMGTNPNIASHFHLTESNIYWYVWPLDHNIYIRSASDCESPQYLYDVTILGILGMWDCPTKTRFWPGSGSGVVTLCDCREVWRCLSSCRRAWRTAFPWGIRWLNLLILVALLTLGTMWL